MRVSPTMFLTIWFRLFGLGEKSGFCSWIALTSLWFLAPWMQQVRVQMHPDADGPHTAQEARHDSIPQEGRRRPPRQWPRHPRLRTGTFIQAVSCSLAKHWGYVSLASRIMLVLGAKMRTGEEVVLGVEFAESRSCFCSFSI